jgi:hypothetical protein
MALFFDDMECMLCGKPMHSEDRLFGTTAFLDADDDLWQFSDAVLHWDCYAKWEHRPRFARKYFDDKGGWGQNNPYWGTAYEDDEVRITINPDPLVAQVDVMLAATGSQTRIPVRDWEDWLGGEWFDKCDHEVERDALASVMPLLRSRFSTVQDLLSAAGMTEPNDSDMAALDPAVAAISYEYAFRALAERAMTKGVGCPRCGLFSQDYECRQVQGVSATGPQSTLVCRSCGGEFGPLDV